VRNWKKKKSETKKKFGYYHGKTDIDLGGAGQVWYVEDIKGIVHKWIPK